MYVYPNVHRSTIYNHQDKKATLMSISRPMDKKAGVQTQWNTTVSKKNTFESVLMRSMKLGPIMQSEVSQKDKHQ